MKGGFIIKKTSLATGMKVKGTYSFKNDIIQRVAYSRMLFRQRQDLHRAVAKHLATDVDSLEGGYEAVASHWWSAFQGATDVNEDDVLLALFYAKRTCAVCGGNAEDTETWRERISILKQITKQDAEEGPDGRRTVKIPLGLIA